MIEIKCADCGGLIGYGNRGDQELLCDACFEEKREREQEETRRVKAEMEDVSNEDILDAIDDWYKFLVSEYPVQVEDEVLYQKVISKLKEVLNCPEWKSDEEK